MSYELMSKRLNAIVPDETWDDLERVAEREMRTKSQMTAILLGEALEEYWKRNPPKPSEEASFRASRFVDEPGRDNLVPSEDVPASKAPKAKSSSTAKAKPTASAKAKRKPPSKS